MRSLMDAGQEPRLFGVAIAAANLTLGSALPGAKASWQTASSPLSWLPSSFLFNPSFAARTHHSSCNSCWLDLCNPSPLTRRYLLCAELIETSICPHLLAVLTHVLHHCHLLCHISATIKVMPTSKRKHDQIAAPPPPTCLPLHKFSHATVLQNSAGHLPWKHIVSQGDIFAVFETVRTLNADGTTKDSNRFKVLQDPNIMV